MKRNLNKTEKRKAGKKKVKSKKKLSLRLGRLFRAVGNARTWDRTKDLSITSAALYH
jgi:hypothetical protein